MGRRSGGLLPAALTLGAVLVAPMLAGCGAVFTQLGVTTGWAAVSWTPPNSTANGTALTNLAGYELFYGRNPSELIDIVKIPDAHVTRMIVRGLDSGTWYFVVTAYARSGAMSVPSNVAGKTIP